MHPNKNIEESFGNNDSKNEFMMGNVNQSQQSAKDQNQKAFPEEYQKMWNFMNMFMKNSQLMKDYCSKMSNSQVQPPQQNVESHRKRQYQVQQHKYRNHEVSPKAKNQHKKGQDVMKKYVHKTQNQHPNMIQSTISVQEDQGYVEPERKQEPRENKFFKHNPYDEIPIKSAYTQSLSNNENSMINNFNSNFNDKRENASKVMDERPIQGVSRKWEEHIESTITNSNENQKFINTVSQYPPQYQNQINEKEDDDEQPKSGKPFLKRGSRQYLSSAKDKSVVKKKKPAKQKNEHLDRSTDKVQLKNERSLSQNRLLNKKRPPTDKSINKGASRMTERQLSPKVSKKQVSKISHSPSFKQINDAPSSPPIQKKRTAKTNVFEDESSSQNEQQTLKLKTRSTFRQLPKQQVIPGVFLTKGQLKQILQKHGKANSLTYEDEKIKELKKKYIDLCNLTIEEKQHYERQKEMFGKEKQEFQTFKASQLVKIKNERKLQQKQLLNRQTQNNNLQKEKEEIELMKKQVERQKEEFKKKDKNNRIILEKYKKQIEEMKMKLSLCGNDKKPEYVCNSCGNGNNSKKETIKKATTKNSKIQKEQFEEDYYEDDRKRKTSRYEKEKGQEKIKNSKYRPKLQNEFEEEESQFEKSKKMKFSYKENKNQKIKVISSSESEYEENEDVEDEKQEIVEYNRKMTLSDLTKIPLSIKMVTEDMVENMFKYKSNPQYLLYVSISKGNRQKLSTTRNTIQKKLTNIYRDGGKEMIYQNGVKKQYFPNGYSIVFFGNGDIKQKLSDGTVLYYYRDREVDQITLSNNMNIYRFQNNQIEFHYEDKRIQIRHPDGSLKVM